MSRCFLLLLGFSLLPSSLPAYVPTLGEFRYLWNRERRPSKPVLLEYEGSGGIRFRIYIHPKGVWAKQLFRSPQTREWVVKAGGSYWVYRKGSWEQEKRERLYWDDWIFEPDLSLLESLAPRDFFLTRGVGEYERKRWIWIYGAHHHLAPGAWVGFLRNPLRPALIHYPDLMVRCLYSGARSYPEALELTSPRGTGRFTLVRLELNPSPEQVPLPAFLKP